MVARGARRGWWAPVLALVVLVGIAATTRVRAADGLPGASRTIATSAAEGQRTVAVLPTVHEHVALADVGLLGAGCIALLLAARWLAPADDRRDRRSIQFLGVAWQRRGPPFLLSD
jgi:hypothetical protein